MCETSPGTVLWIYGNYTISHSPTLTNDNVGNFHNMIIIITSYDHHMIIIGIITYLGTSKSSILMVFPDFP